MAGLDKSEWSCVSAQLHSRSQFALVRRLAVNLARVGRDEAVRAAESSLTD